MCLPFSHPLPPPPHPHPRLRLNLEKCNVPDFWAAPNVCRNKAWRAGLGSDGYASQGAASRQRHQVFFQTDVVGQQVVIMVAENSAISYLIILLIFLCCYFLP